MFKDFKNLKGLASAPGAIKEALQMQRKMKAQEVTVTHGGVEITIRGDLQIKQVKVNGELRNDLRDAFNRAVKEIQQKMAGELMM